MRSVPLATYRLQLGPGFGFAQAGELAGYLGALGITHLYLSPVFQAGPGSTHGYDIVDPTRISSDLGGEGTFRAMAERLAREEIGLILDVVPNHMAINSPRNRWWWDVLAKGAESRFASYFDIDWPGDTSSTDSKVLVPVLGDHYGRVLERGELFVADDAEFGWVLRYGDRLFPLSPDSLDHLRSEVGEPGLAPAALAAWVNKDPDRLDALLEHQNYRLAFWKVASEELDYRRFFDIDSMAGVRVEDDAVFDATHELVLDLVRSEAVDGLRIDHVDGLADPRRYLARLHDSVPSCWTVVEKILEEGEELPTSWPVAGTTGYDYLNLIAGLFIDPDGLESLGQIYADISGADIDFGEIGHGAKHEIMATSLATDVNRVANLFAQVCGGHRRFRDYTRSELAQVVEEMLACMPVYRTYIATNEAPSRSDVELMELVAAQARRRRPDLDVAPNTFLSQVLCGRWRYWGSRRPPRPPPAGAARPSDHSTLSLDELDPIDRAEIELRVRFAQVSVAIMAKAVEDTAFYRYHRLISANEVGGNPAAPSIAPEDFHRACLRRAVEQPEAMVTTSTHDTKRGEDGRARISLLSEMPDEWGETVRRWMARNQAHYPAGFSDVNAEYLMYQTLIGSWPIGPDRLVAFMLKAAREAKVRTSWTDPDETYEANLEQFVRSVTQDDGFTTECSEFLAPLIRMGRTTSLAQAALRLTVPGVVDTYQGSELWNTSLVDPDNRRAVDFAHHQSLLAQIDGLSLGQILERSEEGIPKLALTVSALRLRRDHPEWLGPGASYQPINVEGDMARHAMAFARGSGVVVVVPRLVLGLERSRGWGETSMKLLSGRWQFSIGRDRQVFEGGEPIAMSQMLARFPVAILRRLGD